MSHDTTLTYYSYIGRSFRNDFRCTQWVPSKYKVETSDNDSDGDIVKSLPVALSVETRSNFTPVNELYLTTNLLWLLDLQQRIFVKL